MLTLDAIVIWPFHWLVTLPISAFPHSVISAELYPKSYQWISRFDKCVKTVAGNSPKPTTVKGPVALKQILSASVFATTEVDKNDPLGLREGTYVEVWPVDSGSSGRTRGIVVGISVSEIVLVVPAKEDKNKLVHVHFPRIGFRAREVDAIQAKI